LKPNNTTLSVTLTQKSTSIKPVLHSIHDGVSSRHDSKEDKADEQQQDKSSTKNNKDSILVYSTAEMDQQMLTTVATRNEVTINQATLDQVDSLYTSLYTPNESVEVEIPAHAYTMDANTSPRRTSCVTQSNISQGEATLK